MLVLIIGIVVVAWLLFSIPKIREDAAREEREKQQYISEIERERAYHNKCIDGAANGDESAIAYLQMVSGRSREDVISRAKRAMLEQ